MAKILYTRKRFSLSSLALIEQSNDIIADYAAQGYDLTLRQLYYQLVARDIIPNMQTEYKRLGSIINDARLAGLIDWNRIQDLTRELRSVSHWDSPSDIISSAAHSFRIDKWEDQAYRPEVWVEKDALRNVVERVCTELDIPYFACRGYVSQSEMWSAAQRLINHSENGQTPLIIHLGDHDPSGIDMTRDIKERLEIFNCDLTVDRQALNMDQIDKYGPPPNPAKTTDSRYIGYIRNYGTESWELDALDPSTLTAIITKSVLKVRQENKWKKAIVREKQCRKLLTETSNSWSEVTKFLKEI